MTNPSSDLSIEERVAALEAAVAKLQQQSSTPVENWVDQLSGSFKDDPEFDKVLRYGREFRRSDYPDDDQTMRNDSSHDC
ncbi:hypothetical protein [Leptolyngbya sp. NIES-2104]|uniref:hypothetical protein n=1 Tax=Leptolyngbya sp. NIES-2104 TaxID=1552121 RepID=UPI0006EC6F01|nr:hypothetical protein [Leptolyngbya sp. NIES-2104]GAP93701.1 hypothetical protein NIES2104_02080 [Leptolyngbya sp. NIES-2104]